MAALIKEHQIKAYKKDWVICESCFCSNLYFTGTDMPEFMCLDDTTFLCMTDTCSGMKKRDSDPKICTICCPGLVVYPKPACCATLKDILEGEELEKVKSGNPAIADAIENYLVCGGFCLGDFAAGAQYCHPIATDGALCKSEKVQFPLCCFYQDCAFPPKMGEVAVPLTFAPCCGLLLFPQVGLCKKVGEIYDFSDAPAAEENLTTPLVGAEKSVEAEGAPEQSPA